MFFKLNTSNLASKEDMGTKDDEYDYLFKGEIDDFYVYRCRSAFVLLNGGWRCCQTTRLVDLDVCELDGPVVINV